MKINSDKNAWPNGNFIGTLFLRDSPGEMKSGINSRKKTKTVSRNVQNTSSTKLKLIMDRSLQEKCQHRKFLITAELMQLTPKHWMGTSPKSNWMRVLFGIIRCFHIKITARWYNREKTCLWGRCESTRTKGLGKDPAGPGKSLPQGQEGRNGCVGSMCPWAEQQTLPCARLPTLQEHLAAFPPSPLSGFPLFLPFLNWPLIPGPACQSHRVLAAISAKPQLNQSAAYPNGRNTHWRKRFLNLQTWHSHFSYTSHVLCMAFSTCSEAG